MPNANDLVKTIKVAALDAVYASNPVNVCFGEVKEVSPLKISVEQKLLLGESQLILCRNVTDYVADILMDNLNTSRVVMRNALNVGDRVVMIRQQGGQKFVVLDRMG